MYTGRAGFECHGTWGEQDFSQTTATKHKNAFNSVKNFGAISISANSHNYSVCIIVFAHI